MSSFTEDMDKLSLVEKWPQNLIRQKFIDYFVKKHGHTNWPSSPVVPHDDPTILFANAGMNQYKPLFLGTCDPTDRMYGMKSAVNSQKCIRAGGKHNDLEDVGKDVYHHTYFEMLGNWSFGDYFKKEAIEWAWDCLTVTYGLDPDRMYATYFGGDESQGLPADEEAKAIWLKLLPAERVLPFGCKDNFWEMGNVGPCGPCTEIHYDRIGNRDAADRVNADLPDVIEIWNLVFIQFNREADSSLTDLPAKHVDTGMGLERLASILQGKDSNYDTDIFTPIFDAIQKATGCRPYTGKVGKDDADVVDMAYRVVADHIRTLTFAITDGAMPSAEGRGYVLRRILRRAVRYGQEILKGPAGFFTQLTPVVVENFKEAFPEIEGKMKHVMSVLQDEEISFNRTLNKGVKHFKKVVAGLRAKGVTVVPAVDCHHLFGSMGFPVDLTELMAEEEGLTVDKEGFEVLMDRDRKISEAAERARKGGGSKDMSLAADQTSWLADQGIAVTESNTKYTRDPQLGAKVVAIFNGRSADGLAPNAGFLPKADIESDFVGVITNETAYYYESGGQIYDTGIMTGSDFEFAVQNVQTYGGYVVHVGCLTKGSLSVGDDAVLTVDYERRDKVAPNHTMTHVLNHALREVLTKEDSSAVIDQKGSLVDEMKLRFDFSWGKALTVAQCKAVEDLVTENIEAKHVVHAEVVPLAAASEIGALRAVFGERYPDPVRVISVGAAIPDLLAAPKDEKWNTYSIEFCGGTHLSNSAEAKAFALVEQTPVAKGIRRVVAYTGEAAVVAAEEAAALVAAAEEQLCKVTPLVHLEGAAAAALAAEVSDAMKAIKLSLDASSISVVKKDAVNGIISKTQDVVKVYKKKVAAAKSAEALESITQLAPLFEANPTCCVVLNADISADAKMASQLTKKFEKLYKEGSLLMASHDADSNKLGVFTVACKTHQVAGLDGKAWCVAGMDAAGGGKGGGKPGSGMGFVMDAGPDKVSVALSAGATFASSKGLTVHTK